MKIKNILFSITISIIFLYFIFKIININDLKIIFQLPIKIVIFCFFLYLLSNILRALRFKLFLNMNFLDITSMTFLHNMINNIIPLRIGDLSIIFLGKDKKIKNVIALIYSRIFDVLAISSLLITSMIIYLLKLNKNFELFSLIEKKIVYASIILVIMIFFILALIFFILKYELLNKILSISLVKKFINTHFISRKIVEIKKNISLKKSIFAYFYSLLIWFLNFYITNNIINLVGINLNFYEVVFVFSFTTLISLLPIHGFLGLGTLEAGWALILVFFGVEKELALISAFAFHIINIVFFMILGVFGLLYNLLQNIIIKH
ncbi:MAG: lysylphosphatidylglycerol synthase transmembrane domain-containing protein [Candidatus Woesearchaeota archaeon]